MEALEKAHKNGVKITIVFNYPEDAEKRKEVKQLLEDKLSFLKEGKELIPITTPLKDHTNFMLVDRWHSGVEKGYQHSEVYYWSPVTSWALNQRFNLYVSNQSKVSGK